VGVGSTEGGGFGRVICHRPSGRMGGGCALVPTPVHTPSMTETNQGTHLILFGMQNRKVGPCLAAINRILISVLAGTPRRQGARDGRGADGGRRPGAQQLRAGGGKCGAWGGQSARIARVLTLLPTEASRAGRAPGGCRAPVYLSDVRQVGAGHLSICLMMAACLGLLGLPACALSACLVCPSFVRRCPTRSDMLLRVESLLPGPVGCFRACCIRRPVWYVVLDMHRADLSARNARWLLPSGSLSACCDCPMAERGRKHGAGTVPGTGHLDRHPGDTGGETGAEVRARSPAPAFEAGPEQQRHSGLAEERHVLKAGRALADLLGFRV
jgi:hypothetical protein